MFQGATVRNREDLDAFTGARAVEAILGDDRREAFQLCLAQLKANYAGGVDFQLADQSSLLCAQTADFLYDRFTPKITRYQRGMRPRLELLVQHYTEGLSGERDRMLALLRFCRDLYQKIPGRNMFEDDDYIYGGTEEELIDKGEELCECLGRLFVSLCEIAGIPARLVIHFVGGHITAEALLDGKWAYVDPRAGLYFLKKDGTLASTWELWQQPEILREQPAHVMDDVSDRWTWDERIWKCEHQFFHADEITGFVNYSLADAGRYDYSQVSQALAAELGLWELAVRYEALTKKIFSLAEDGWRLHWSNQHLRKRSLIYRNDGFTPFFLHTPPMSAVQMTERYIDPLAGTNVDIIEWGLGPGSVFCYDTRVGQVYGEPLTAEQRAMLCEGDRNVWRNVTGMIAEGVDPLKAAIDRGHAFGLTVYTRLEMNHEYGPPSDDNWMWVGLVGDFNKHNPHYRIAGHVNLDFTHPQVRHFKLAILREAAERGSDCLSLDFAVYPPFFETPDPAIMTGFLQDVRRMADEVGSAQRRRIELMVRFPAGRALEFGLDWREWMRHKLVDAVVPSFDDYGTVFDLDLDEFISMRNRTGVRVYGCMFQELGYCETDPAPDDEKLGRKWDKPKTKDIWYAQAMLFHRAGVDGIQLAMAADEWNQYPLSFEPRSAGYFKSLAADEGKLIPFFNDLADPFKMRYADKRYMANRSSPHKPTMTLTDARVPIPVVMRIADDPAGAVADGQQPKGELLIYCNRLLSEGEEVTVELNGRWTLRITPESLSWDKPIPDRINYFDPNWWRVGEYTVGIDAAWLKLGQNTLEFTRHCTGAAVPGMLEIRWIDLKITYLTSV
jgi:hypothetical protein